MSQEEPLSLALLQDFLRNPVRHFFTQRLKVYFEAAEAPLADEEPFVLDALQRYTLSDSLLEAALRQPDNIDQALKPMPDVCKTAVCCPWPGSASACNVS
jgi:exodeoxyribonuclease V gamma subunit